MERCDLSEIEMDDRRWRVDASPFGRAISARVATALVTLARFDCQSRRRSVGARTRRSCRRYLNVAGDGPFARASVRLCVRLFMESFVSHASATRARPQARETVRPCRDKTCAAACPAADGCV